MKKIILIAILFITIFFSANVSAEENIEIVCTNSVLADFTSNLITKNVTIDYIMPSGVCPAYYDVKPSDINKIVNADIIISFGSPSMEPWLNDLLSYNENCEIIECKDMGEWNIPTGAISYIEYIKEQLVDIIPEKNQTIIQNSENYILEINDKAEQLKSYIVSNNYSDRKIISMSWQKDFLEYFGLNVICSYAPPQSLSLRDELNITEAASDPEVCLIIDNLQSGTDFGAKVASETGAIHVIFTNFPEAIPGTDTYLDMIDYNIQQLIEGIQTYDSNQGDLKNLRNQVSELELQRNTLGLTTIIFIVLAIIFFIFYKRK